MSIDTETKNTTSNGLLPLRILLAASDPAEIVRIRSNIDEEFQSGIKTAKDYDDLLALITQERPQLVLLGRIDKFNYFDICKECHRISEDLPIVLVSTQETISDSFRKLVKTCGLTDAIPQDAVKLNQLLQGASREFGQLTSSSRNPPPPPASRNLDRSIEQPKIQQPTIAGKNMLAGLEEIVTISNNYFGPLAQGNYWRKAHARIVDEFPFIGNWSADHFSKISCDESILERALTAEDIHSLRVWVMMFIEECERIIVDFRSILTNSDLSPPAKSLLDIS